MQVQNFMIKLQQELPNCYALFCQMHVCETRLERMQDASGTRADASGTHANVNLELSCTILVVSKGMF